MSKVKNESLRVRCRFLRDSNNPNGEWLLFSARAELDFECGENFSNNTHDPEDTDCCDIWVELDLEKLSALLPEPFPVMQL